MDDEQPGKNMTDLSPTLIAVAAGAPIAAVAAWFLFG